RFQLERGIPRAALGTVEPRTQRMRMAEGRVDDGRVRHAEHELVRADVWSAARLGQQPVVRRLIQIKDFPQVLVIVGDADEDAGLASLRGDQTMRVELADEGDRRQRHQPARRASRSRRTTCMAGTPPLIMNASGGSPARMGFVFGRCTQLSASLSLCRMFSALKMPMRYDTRVSRSGSSTRSGFSGLRFIS